MATTSGAGNTPRRVAMNRSFTVPNKIATTSHVAPTAEIGSTKDVETLYVHPNASVVKFSTPSASRPNSSVGQASPRNNTGDQSTGTLPWASSSERTVAAGPLEIYRVPGSVSFLHSGALLHAIMPRSQCWCVDGASKFAFRELQDTYYRIELPAESPEDLELVEALKLTLKKVLFYERTPCPFARGFSVDLPDQEAITVRKGRRRSDGPAKKWKLQRAYSWKPEDGEQPERRGSADSSIASSAQVTDDEGGEEEDASSDEDQPDERLDPVKFTTPNRPTRMSNLRSITAPPQLTVSSTPPSKTRANPPLDPPAEADEQAEVGAEQPRSTPSLRFESIPTDMPPSPPESSAGQDDIDSHTPAKQSKPRPQTFDQRRVDAVAAKQEEREWTGNKDEIDALRKAADSVEPTLGEQMNNEMEAFEDESATVDGPPVSTAATQHANETAFTYNEKSSKDLAEAIPVANIELTPEQEREVNEAVDSLGTQTDPQHASEERIPFALSTPPRKAPSTTHTPAAIEHSDPYARIHAHIRARQSIGSPTAITAPRRYSSSSDSDTTAANPKRASKAKPTQVTTRPPLLTTTSTLIRKTCAVFLGPPAGLVQLMLRIAARFGRFREDVGEAGVWAIGKGRDLRLGGRKVPGSFDLEDELGNEADAEIEEDDFGVPLRSPVRLASVAAAASALTIERREAVERRSRDVE